MGLLGPSFQIGRSALAAYQAAISVVGQNIANVGNPNYTRQSGRLTPLVGGAAAGALSPGAGVANHLSLRVLIDPLRLQYL